jgi:adenine-specific DNA-methyltransferase
MLGQVFTPTWIADYMAALCIKKSNERGLEPCFGQGVFITTMAERLIELNKGRHAPVVEQITGIELDPELFLYGIKEYQKIFPEIGKFDNLFLGNFFEFKKGKSKFDFVMMNPPYVRQEDLNSSDLPDSLKKRFLLNCFEGDINVKYLQKKANLYIYFFYNAFRFLKEGGHLVAITYNSWLFSDYGHLLQKFFLDNFKIRYIIDFDKEAFDEAIIGSCIVLLEKVSIETNRNERDENKVRFIRLKAKAGLEKLLKATESDDAGSDIVCQHVINQKNLYGEKKWEKFFFLPSFHQKLVANPKLIPLSGLATIFRGREPLTSAHFIFTDVALDKLKIEREFVTPILKDPKTLVSLRTSDRKISTFTLNIEKDITGLIHESNSKMVIDYLKRVENEVTKNPDKFKTLVSRINQDRERWHIQKCKPPGDIVFGYIIQERKKFYFNDIKIPTTDNFHNIISKIDPYVLFATLNSTLTQYMLELSGRTQGSGLLKFQVYELEDLLVPNLQNAPENILSKLKKYGKTMSGLSRDELPSAVFKKLLDQIDEVIFDYLEIVELRQDIVKAERHIRKNRLNRKK